MDQLTLEIAARSADAGLIDRIALGLDASLPGTIPGYEPLPLTMLLKEGDAVQGALVGQSVWDWLYVHLLWVDQARQGQGLGTRLMRAAETEAEKRGLIGIWVSTYSFQAPTFYERLGYRAFGRIEDFPKGHVRHFFQKRLDRTAP